MPKLRRHPARALQSFGHVHSGMAWAKQSSVIGTIENVKAASAKDSFRGAMADSLRGWQALSPPKTVRIFRLPEVSDGELQARFEKLVSTWEEDTAFTSALDEMVLHQDYQDIIGMGFQALPYIFARLEASPARWFWALRSIVGVDVAANATSADEAVARWRDWAIANGYTA